MVTAQDSLLIRPALVCDIARIQEVRHSVRENVLSDSVLVTDALCAEFLTKRGKGWVAEVDGLIQGFAVADLQDNNIWALFVCPEFEGRGLGSKLHDTMLNWYFDQGKPSVWLSTEPNTRAAAFYARKGWNLSGKLDNGELRFEFARQHWAARPDSH